MAVVLTPEVIKERKEFLNEAISNLKSHFIGINGPINQIWKLIETWWLYPEFLIRPTIINLWGLTGSGKTDLVYKLVQELGLKDQFCSINLDLSIVPPSMDRRMDNMSLPGNWGGDGSNRSISGRLYNNGIKPNARSVLLLDDIQKIRTTKAAGNLDWMPGSDSYADMWKLFSDGFLEDKKSIIDYLRTIISNIDSNIGSDRARVARLQSMDKGELAREYPFGGSGLTHKLYENCLVRDNEYQFNLNKICNLIFFTEEEVQTIYNYRIVLSMNGALEPLTSDEIGIINNSPCKVKELLRLMPISYFRTIIYTKLNELVNNDDFDDDAYVYSKMLIFVCGNLDGVYRKSLANKKCTPNELYEITKKITTQEVIKELHEMFLPEQVSRLGNNHIIYTSLTIEDFEIIVNNEIKLYEKKFSSKYGVDINFNEYNIFNKIKNDIDPIMGIRPVLSRVASMIGIILPSILKEKFGV